MYRQVSGSNTGKGAITLHLAACCSYATCNDPAWPAVQEKLPQSPSEDQIQQAQVIAGPTQQG